MGTSMGMSQVRTQEAEQAWGRRERTGAGSVAGERGTCAQLLPKWVILGASCCGGSHGLQSRLSTDQQITPCPHTLQTSQDRVTDMGLSLLVAKRPGAPGLTEMGLCPSVHTQFCFALNK